MTQRVQLQNHLRAVLVAQGLDTPRGHRAWTAAGLAHFEALARAPQDCAADELWRGQLHVALGLYRGLVVQLDHVEAKLDALLRDDAPSQRLLSVPGKRLLLDSASCGSSGNAGSSRNFSSYRITRGKKLHRPNSTS